jgi:acyl carrier protein
MPMERNEVAATVVECLAAVLEIEASTITESQRFAEDLDADSIALVEFVFDLEEQFRKSAGDFAVNDDDLAELKTVGSVVDYVHEALSK